MLWFNPCSICRHMNLPQFTAGLALYRTTRVYREFDAAFALDDAPMPGVHPSVVAAGGCPPGFLGTPPNCYTTGVPGGGNHCATACAGSCQGLSELEYNFCYQQCYDACSNPGGECVAPPGSCHPEAYCQCVGQNQNLPPDWPRADCGSLYGPCPAGRSCCASGCSDTNIDSLNCGSCNHACENDSTCCGGSCCGGTGTNQGCCPYTGRTGLGLGNYTCVGLLPNGQPEGETDNPYNCGTCGNVCSNDGPANSHPVCLPPTTGGMLLPTRCSYACNPGFTECGGLCVMCPDGGVCSGTSCVCPGGMTPCGPAPGVCSNLQEDPDNCGSCGFTCISGSTCTSGKCLCSGSSSRPCGNCGTQTRTCNANGTWSGWSTCSGQGTCAPGSRQSCEQNGTQTCGSNCKWGACTCSSPNVLCRGLCVNTSSDPNNCGSCGHGCDGKPCVGGQCAPCASGQQLCGGQCFTPPGQACCGSTIYDPTQNTCCADGDADPAAGYLCDPDSACCGGGLCCDLGCCPDDDSDDCSC
jgi:hypothetical protein